MFTITPMNNLNMISNSFAEFMISAEICVVSQFVALKFSAHSIYPIL